MGACLSFCHAATAPCCVPWPRRKRRARKLKAIAKAAASAVVPSTGELRLGFARNFADRYELGHEIGHGQYARVHAARDGRTAEAVAVKAVPKALLVAPDAAEDISREVRVAHRACAAAVDAARSKVAHRTDVEAARCAPQVRILRALSGRPHVVKLLDAFEDDDTVYLVMECVILRSVRL